MKKINEYVIEMGFQVYFGNKLHEELGQRIPNELWFKLDRQIHTKTGELLYDELGCKLDRHVKDNIGFLNKKNI